MALSPVRRAALRRELADAVFRVFSVLGLMGGFAWAYGHQARPPACPAHTARTIGHCMSSTMVEVMIPWLTGIGGGTLLGAALGAMLARTIVR